MRSRAAAAILADAGLENVYNMQGGIAAWEGRVASGLPESGMAYFGDSVQPQELAMLAWMLEDGSRLFYVRMDEYLRDEEARKLFQHLAHAEAAHEKTVAEMYRGFTRGGAVEDDLPSGRGDIMEGGIQVGEALLWAKGKDVTAILEFAISLETNAYDLYLKMERSLEGDAKKVFLLLAGEEKKHLERLADLLEKKV
jgi:rubrerythrin